MKKLLSILMFLAVSLTVTYAQDIITKKNGEDIKAKVLEENQNSYSDLYKSDREPIDGIKPNMKYKELKALYNYLEFTPTMADRYAPAWSGVASYFITGLGQMICGEVGRGCAYLGGAIGCYIVAVGGAVVAESVDPIAGLITILAAAGGILTIKIFAIVDAIRVAKVKNMYWQDLRKKYALDINLYPSVNYIQYGNSIQPTAGLTLAMTF